MKKLLLISVILSVCFGCVSNQNNTKYLDSLRIDTNAGKPKPILEPCPVTVIKSKLIEDEYGYKSISVRIKNISKKTIDAVSLSWILQNNFGDIVNDNYIRGIAQEKLKPGKSDTHEWDLYRTTATKCKVYITKVHFTDDSKWQLINE